MHRIHHPVRDIRFRKQKERGKNGNKNGNMDRTMIRAMIGAKIGNMIATGMHADGSETTEKTNVVRGWGEKWIHR